MTGWKVETVGCKFLNRLYSKYINILYIMYWLLGDFYSDIGLSNTIDEYNWQFSIVLLHIYYKEHAL